METKEFFIKAVLVTLVIIIIIIGLFWSLSFGWKHYKVWSYAQDGKAELARAEWEKKISIETAKAANESAALTAEANITLAKSQAQSEIERAKGVAEANKIIGESLKNNEEYLRYLWITSIDKSNVIYVPTEAGLPILEAGKRP